MSNVSSNKAIKLALLTYAGQIKKLMPWSFLGLVLPGSGIVLTRYVPPLIIANMIQHFDGKVPADLNQALPFIAALGGTWLAGELLWRIAFLCLIKTDADGMEKLYNHAMEQMLKKDISFFNNNFAGSLTKKVIGLHKNFEAFTDTLAFNVFGILIPLIFACFILWGISPLLMLLFVATLLLTIAVTTPLILNRHKLVKARERAANEVAGHVADVISNAASVQAFGHEQKELKRHKELVGDYIGKARKSWFYHALYIDSVLSPIYIIANVGGLMLAIVTTESTSALTSVFVTFSYFSLALYSLFEFNRVYRNLESSITEAAQFTDLIVDPPRLTENKDAHDIKVNMGAIDFNDVEFRYHDDNAILFSKLNLHIKPGEKIALVGRSGGGKTTVTKMLLRFVDLTNGQILIDGQNIKSATFKSLRSNIAYVPQDSAMFHRSILDNIKYGKDDATMDEIISAAKRAHAYEFISKLPDGFNTMVGERGIKLSGGQRQRIAIARAILKDAPILVLDEATSALDSESERLIQDALKELMKNRTSIVIAHRLSTVQNMDRIIVLDNGQIIEQGSHDQLVNKRGIYHQLWSHQSGGFISD